MPSWESGPYEENEQPWDENERGWEEEQEPGFWTSPEETGESWNEEGESCVDDPDYPALYSNFSEIPAWSMANDYSNRIAQLTEQIDPEAFHHPALINLRRQSYFAAADIALGHDEGYGRQHLELHLEHCRQGLDRIHQCLWLIETLSAINAISNHTYRLLFDQSIAVRDAIVHWMEELRFTFSDE